jgi:hypothetical protein
MGGTSLRAGYHLGDPMRLSMRANNLEHIGVVDPHAQNVGAEGGCRVCQSIGELRGVEPQLEVLAA